MTPALLAYITNFLVSTFSLEYSSLISNMKLRSLLSLLSLPFLASSQSQNTFSFSSADCPGYSLSNLSKSPTSLRATLSLIGGGCTAFGNDIKTLTLEVNYETKERLHVHIYDTVRLFPLPSFLTVLNY
jgi:hypothetical protein